MRSTALRDIRFEDRDIAHVAGQVAQREP
jgi:hypothetical protein